MVSSLDVLWCQARRMRYAHGGPDATNDLAIVQAVLLRSGWGLRGGLRVLQFCGFPGVVATGEVGDLLEAGAAQDAGGDGAAIAALAVDDDELGGVEFGGAVGELAERDADGVFEGSGFDFAGLADVEDGEVVLLFFLKVG